MLQRHEPRMAIPRSLMRKTRWAPCSQSNTRSENSRTSPDQDRNQIERDEKALADYRAQADKPFEHDAKLKELIARQQELNKALDLDKSDKQAAAAQEDEVAQA